MKLYLVLLMICFCDCTKLSEDYEDNWNYDEDLNLVGLQEDDKEDIYRPCDLRDLKCIQKFFAKNSHCSIVKGRIADPLILKRNSLKFSSANLTLVINNLQISGLNNAKVKEFYVNKDTGNVVFAFDVRGMSERSSRTSFRYLRTGKEPIVLTDFVTITFNLITYTAVIPKVPHLQLHKADIHAFIADADPTLIIGPNASNSTDPQVQRSFASLIANLPTSIREALLLKTSMYVTAFIQSNICDFGQEILSL